MSDQLKVGDIVTLKSGGPDMTIVEIGETYEGSSMQAWCSWFKSSNEPETKHFPLAALRLVEAQ